MKEIKNKSPVACESNKGLNNNNIALDSIKNYSFDVPDSFCGFFGTSRSFGKKCRKCKLLIACVDACQGARA